MKTEDQITIFQDQNRLFTGERREALRFLKSRALGQVFIFEDRTGRQTDFDLSGSLEDVLARALPETASTARPGPGRPRLGVVPREVTLLPRHWEWLETQRGGASATLRRLIDEARKKDPEGERLQQAQAATDRFLGVMAGDLSGYEEAARALYQRDRGSFLAHSAAWPGDIRAHALELAAPVFAGTDVEAD